jgi:hypothetical protein
VTHVEQFGGVIDNVEQESGLPANLGNKTGSNILRLVGLSRFQGFRHMYSSPWQEPTKRAINGTEIKKNKNKSRLTTLHRPL